MKHLTLLTYIFFCTGGTYAQLWPINAEAEIDFNRPTILQFTQYRSDTLRATLLITRGHKQIAHEKPGYVVYRSKDTIYLGDKRIVLKAPVKVWGVKIEKL